MVAKKEKQDARAAAPRRMRSNVLKPQVITPVKRSTPSTSQFRGVTHHCRTGRYEAHIWQSGKQVYLGGFDNERQAARAYDLAAIRFRREDATLNFHIEDYKQEQQSMYEFTEEEIVQRLREQSRGGHRQSSKFRGVTRHQKGKWEARIGMIEGKKYKYLGLFMSEIEAAQAYDRELIRLRGPSAPMNFSAADYPDVLAEIAHDGQHASIGKPVGYGEPASARQAKRSTSASELASPSIDAFDAWYSRASPGVKPPGFSPVLTHSQPATEQVFQNEIGSIQSCNSMLRTAHSMPIPDEVLYDDYWNLDSFDMLGMSVGTPRSILTYPAAGPQSQPVAGKKPGLSVASPTSERSPASQQSRCGTEQLLLDFITEKDHASSTDTVELWVMQPPPGPAAETSSSAVPSSYASPDSNMAWTGIADADHGHMDSCALMEGLEECLADSVWQEQEDWLQLFASEQQAATDAIKNKQPTSHKADSDADEARFVDQVLQMADADQNDTMSVRATSSGKACEARSPRPPSAKPSSPQERSGKQATEDITSELLP